MSKTVACRAFAISLLVFGSLAYAELTLETGQIGEIYFTWQGTLTDAGARSHALSRMNAFRIPYESGLLSSVEVLEITELNTNQSLPFNYVIPTGNARSNPTVRDVVWYYPNPIPSGGRVRLLIRGKILSERVYLGDQERIEFAYRSDDEVLFILPAGYSITYSSGPIIIYEKDARTVASFPRVSSEIALIAKDARTQPMGADPVISRDVLAIPTSSTLDLLVEEVDDAALLEYARNRVNNSIQRPVLLAAVVDVDRITEPDRVYFVPGQLVVWSVNDVVIDGADGFYDVTSQLQIGTGARLGVIVLHDDGAPAASRTVSVLVRGVDD